jgi:RsiW-degrading membrane proteinase PrsW (M82 family)
MGSKTLFLDGVLGFVVGVVICGVLFLLFDIFTYPKDIVAGVLLSAVFLPTIEEVFKYLPLQSSLFKGNYIIVGLMIGLGFGMLESFVRIYPHLNQFGSMLFTYRSGATLLHLDTGLLMGFAVSKKKGWIGLLLAILLHSLFNFYIEFR